MCEHSETTVGNPRPYNGSVYTVGVTEENLCAHGNIVHTRTCSHCGARRRELINGRHQEVSAWGLPRVGLESAYVKARARVDALFPATIAVKEDQTTTVTVDKEGFFVFDTYVSETELHHLVRKLSYACLSAAQRYRDLHVQLNDD